MSLELFAGWLFGKAADAALTKLFTKDLARKLEKRIQSWAQRVPSDYEIDAGSLFQVLPDPFEPAVSAATALLRSKLEACEVPSVEDWLAALLERWTFVRASVDSPQKFFQAARTDAEFHLRELARDLEAECRLDDEFFKTTTLARLDEIRGNRADVAQHRPRDRHDEIDQAKMLLQNQQPKLALGLLTKLRERDWGDLSDREKFRVAANTAGAHQQLRDFPAAIRAFHESYTYQPEDKDARSFRAFAFLLAGDSDRAAELADEILVEFPLEPRPWAIWLDTREPDAELSELIDEIPVSVQGEFDVAFALHSRAAALQEFDLAVELLEAVGPHSDRFELPAYLGFARFASQKAKGARRRNSVEFVDSDQVELAIKELQEAINLSGDSPDKALVAVVHLHLADACSLLDRESEGNAHLQRAMDADPSNPSIAVRYALMLGSNDDLPGAIQALEAIHSASPTVDGDYRLARYLNRRGTEGDAERASKLLSDGVPRLEVAEEPVAFDYLLELVELRHALGDPDSARALVDGAVGRVLSRDGALLVSIRDHVMADRQEEARAELKIVMHADLSQLPYEQLTRLARALEAFEDWSQAATVWGLVVSTSCISNDNLHFLEAARRCADYAAILDHCGRLRGAGIYDDQCVSLELAVLHELNENRAAIEVAADCLEHGHEPEKMRLAQSMLGLLTEDETVVEHDATLLPQVDDVDAFDGLQVVQLLSHGPVRELAIDYAYSLIRRFPDDPLAHRALAYSIAAPQLPEIDLPAHDSVVAGAAVCFVEDSDTKETWRVLEDQHDPQPSLDEISPTTLLGEALIGLRVGDTFPIGGQQFGARTATVKAILNKHVFRFRRALDEWETRFPEDRTFTKYKFPDDPAELREAFLRHFKEKSASVELAGEQYVAGKAPIGLIGFAADRSTFEAVEHILTTENMGLVAAAGTSDEWNAAQATLEQGPTFVIEPVTLSLWFHLGLFRLVSSLPIDCVVLESARQDVLDTLRRIETPDGRRGGMLTYSGGELVHIPYDSDHFVSGRDELRAFLSWIDANTSSIGGLDALELAPDQREKLGAILGPATLESVAASMQPGRVLWSDDHALARFAMAEFSIERVWTQAVLWELESNGHVDTAIVDEAAVRFISADVGFTRARHASLVRAAELSEWDPEGPQFQRMLGYVTSLGTASSGLVVVLLGAMVNLRRSAPSPFHADRVTRALLDAVAPREDSNGILREIHQQAEVAFGVDVIGGDLVRDHVQGLLGQ